MTMGVYEIINLADGKMTSYVGSSADIKTRWKKHVWMLRNGQHGNLHLQRAWEKHGEGGLSFCVLEQVVDQEYLLEREQHFLDRAFEVGDTYNIAQDAVASMLGQTFSKEHRRRLSEANKGKGHTERSRHKMSKAKEGKNHPGWGKHLSEKTRCKIGETNAGPYPAFSHRETGEIIPAGKNLSRLCREYGLGQWHMWSVVRGQRKSHRGWILKRRRDDET